MGDLLDAYQAAMTAEKEMRVKADPIIKEARPFEAYRDLFKAEVENGQPILPVDSKVPLPTVDVSVAVDIGGVRECYECERCARIHSDPRMHLQIHCCCAAL